jgi:undecaprenyl-diphosphatase
MIFKKDSYLEKLTDDALRDISALGGWDIYLLVILLFLIYSEAMIALMLAAGFIATLAISVLFRVIYFKERPIHHKYTDFLGKLDASSFPSLHAMRTAFLMLILIEFFSSYYLKILIFCLTLAICYSRIYLKKHYWTDVIVGFALGAIMAYIAVMAFF